MTIEFLLKRKPTGHHIYVAIYQGQDMVQISTGEKISLKQWDVVARRPKDQDSEISVAIGIIKDDINKIRRLMAVQGIEVTPRGLRAHYKASKQTKAHAQKKADDADYQQSAFVTTLIEKWKKEGLYNYQPRTKAGITYSMNLFQAFIKKRYPRLERKELTFDILNKYALYLDELEIADSSHGSRIKHLRWFLAWIGIPDDVIKKLKIRTVKQDERNIIPLTQDELKKLIAYKTTDLKQKAKDMFLLGCFTGLRISDLKRINKHRIINGTIEITQKKNRRLGSIPVLPQAKAILKRYDWQAPKISEKHVNEEIKLICAAAEINTPTFFKRKQNGLLIETLYPKNELITIHTAIKTFISMAGPRWGLRAEEIAAIVGKDVKTILGYYMKPDIKDAKQKMLAVENRAKMKVV